MNGLKVFTNEEFGDVAVINIDNKPYFEGVKVASVNTVNVKPKAKRVGKYTGYTNKVKKAIVTLTADSKNIEIFGE